MAETFPNRDRSGNGEGAPGIPGSASLAHPSSGIPLPDHGFETLDPPERESASVPAGDTVSRAAVALLSAASEKLGLIPGEEPDIDLPEARVLIEALAGLLAASRDHLGPHHAALLDGVRTLQTAFREAAAHPDEPGRGPGEALLAGS